MSSDERIKIERATYNQSELNNEFNYFKPKKNSRNYCQSTYESCNLKTFIFAKIPIIAWLSQYSIRTDLPGDIISGVTIAIVQIPQAIGSALLADVPPINGIYTAIFPVFIYTIFGSSRHTSMGTFIIINVMISHFIVQWSDLNIDLGDDALYTPAQVGTVFTFNIGVILLCMYVFRLGCLSALMSEVLVLGFTSGAAVIVASTQIKYLLGIQMPRITGYFQLINTIIELFKGIFEGNYNWFVAMISLVTIIVLLINVYFITPNIIKRCPFPIPMEIVVIIIGTILAKAYDFKNQYGVKLVDEIPTGLPSFTAPPFELVPNLIIESIGPAMIAYSVSISMALSIAQDGHYDIDANQELLACGLINTFGSFLSCIPIVASLSRSVLQFRVGGKTQATNIISASLLLIVLLWIGPFFEHLPVSIVASIVVVTLQKLLVNIKKFKGLWDHSHLDGMVWIVTFIATISIRIDMGLATGFAMNLLCIIIREMRPYMCLLGHIPSSNLYLDIDRYKEAQEINSIKIFHYCGSLNFISGSYFRKRLCTRIDFDMEKALKTKSIDKPSDIKFVVIDFSALTYIDSSAIGTLKLLINDFKKCSIRVLISGSSCKVFDMMKKCNLFDNDDYCDIFPTIDDAVIFAKGLMKF